MTTPILPDNPTLSTFGGPYADYDNVVDPTTDMSASYFNRLLAQACALSFVAPRAWVRCTVVSGVISLQAHGAVWGDSSAVAPSVVRTGAGVYQVSWASSYSDLQAVPETHSFVIRAAQITANMNSATLVIAQATFAGGSTAFVTTNDRSTGAATDASFTLMVW